MRPDRWFQPDLRLAWRPYTRRAWGGRANHTYTRCLRDGAGDHCRADPPGNPAGPDRAHPHGQRRAIVSRPSRADAAHWRGWPDRTLLSTRTAIDRSTLPRDQSERG